MTKGIFSLESHPAVIRLIKRVKEDDKQEKELTFSKIAKLLPSEILNHEDLIDNLLIILSNNHIEVIDEYHNKAEVSEEKKNNETNQIIEKLAADNRRLDDPIRLYLKEIGKITLLTKEEECMHAMNIEKGEKEIIKVVHKTDATYKRILYHIQRITDTPENLDLIFNVLEPPRIYNVSSIEKQRLKTRYVRFQKKLFTLYKKKTQIQKKPAAPRQNEEKLIQKKIKQLFTKEKVSKSLYHYISTAIYQADRDIQRAQKKIEDIEKQYSLKKKDLKPLLKQKSNRQVLNNYCKKIISNLICS